MPGAKAGRKLPVLALDVVDDGRARPSQQRPHDQGDALARSRSRQAQHTLRPAVSETIALELAEHQAGGTEQTGGPVLVVLGQPYRSLGPDGRSQATGY